MSNVCVYSFADATGLTTYVDDVGDFTFAGTWSGTGTYSAYPLTAVDYSNGLYMCIRDNIGDNPQRPVTRTRPQSWSIMALLYEYQCSGTTTDAASAAYALAQSGTNIAWAAYYLAQIGTNTGSAAYDLAGSAYALAGTALYIAQSGSNTANYAFTIAVAGTNAAAAAQSTSDAAYRLAQIGTNTGTAALNAAATAQSTASSAFSIAVIGTNAAASAQSTASSAFGIAVAGTNAAASAQSTANTAYFIAQAGTDAAATAQSTANSAWALAQIGTNVGSTAYSVAEAAYALAQLGTIPPYLDELQDVSVPAPSFGQILTFNGSVWVAGDNTTSVATGAFTYYLDDVASGTAGYQTLSPAPMSGPEEQDSVTLSSGTTLIESYISGTLNRTRIDAGVWEFDTYASVDYGTATSSVMVEVYTRSIGGLETQLFTVNTGNLAVPASLVITQTVQGSYAISPNDKVVAKYYGITDSATPLTISIYHNGTDHYSHIHTPLGFLHNDLGGLQGGSPDQFYHVTFDQNNALTGVGGYPSATNQFVTTYDPRLVGDVAYALAQIGTNTGTAALNAAASAQSTADSAYFIACVGTNTGTAALAAAATAQSTADTAYFIAQVGTNTGTAALEAAGTAQSTADFAYYLAQVGTNTGTAAYNLALSIPNYTYGGTMLGNLVVPNVIVGVGSTATSSGMKALVPF